MDQTLSVESREHETTVNGLSTWQARPTAANQQKHQLIISFLQSYHKRDRHLTKSQKKRTFNYY